MSLDAFRGLAIAGMIVVNTPGNRRAYPLLAHADWNGCTFADLVFPFFLFIVGVSIPHSLSRRASGEEGPPRLCVGIFRRAALIFGLGLLGNVMFSGRGATFRFPGVLQRIAVCYCAAALLFVATSLWAQGALAALLLAGYWLAMTRVSVPGCGPGVLTPACNLAFRIDRRVLRGHLYQPGLGDPEGLLSTLPALSTTLLGILAGAWLRSQRAPERKVAGMLAAGGAGLAAGLAWARAFPVNKALWTGSYVLLTAGLALWLLALCYGLIEIKGYRAWARPLEVFGVNAIAAYALPIFLLKMLVFWKLPGSEGPRTQLRVYLCDRLFGGWLSPLNASLAFALSYTLLWLGFFWILYRKRIFIKL